jgi:hypothetical protein
VTTPEIIDQNHELILEDRRISDQSTAEYLGISRDQFGSIFHEDLYAPKLSAMRAPKYLNADHKRHECQSSEQIWEFFGRDPNDSLSRLVTIDET